MSTDGTLARTEPGPSADPGLDPAGFARTRPVYTRVQVLGLALVGVTVLLVSVAAIAADPGNPEHVGEVLAFFAPIGAVTLLAAWLAWRFGTWGRAVGLVVSLGAAAMLFWAVAALAEPDSVVDFALGVGVPTGLVLALGGGVAAWLSARRGRLEVAATRQERMIVRGTLALIGFALATSGALTWLGRTTIDPALTDGATPVSMTGFAFVPAEIHVDGADARLVVHNGDPFLHDIAVPALDTGVVRVTPGSTVAVDLAGSAPGTYLVYCTLHSDTAVDDTDGAGMAAVLIVR